MLNGDTKRKIQGARDILVGKIPVPTAQVEQITLALMYKFMSDMDEQAKKLGDKTGFFMGEYEKYSWNKITDTSLSAYDRVALYSEGLEKMNNNPNVPQLFRDIFKGAFLPFKDPETLKLFLDQINEIEYTHSEDLGDAYEYLLSVMGSQGDAGQFRTPRHIIDFIVEIVDPKKEDKILDPACGTAGFLISAYKHILKHNTTKDSKIMGDALSPMDRRNLTRNFVGYDISHEMRRLSLVNMYLHQFPDPQIYEYDTLTSTDHWDEDFDCILANPPFMTPRGGIRPHHRFAVQANRAEVLFVDYIMEHLSTSGKAGIIVPEGIIFQSSNAYKNLRKLLVEDNYLWGVISLPAGVFQPYSGVKTSVLLLDKNIAKKTENILFINVENDGFDLSTNRKENGNNDLPSILESLKKYKEWVLNDKEIKEEELSDINIVEKSRIKESGDYNLSGNKYQSSERGIYLEGRWPMVELGNIAEYINGYPFKPSDWQSEGKEIIRIQNLTGSSSKVNYTNREDIPRKYIVTNGDLLISWSATIGFYLWKDTDAYLNQHIFKVIPNEKIDKMYLFYLGPIIIQQIKNRVHGNTMTHITKSLFNSIKIPLPPIEEQKKIVEELDRYQRIIDGARMVIDNWKPEIEIDPEWEKAKLGELCDVRDGTHDSPKYVNHGIPLITSKNLKEGVIDFSNVNYVSEEDHKKISKRSEVSEGDIIFAMIGTIGNPVIVKKDREFSIKNVALIKFLKQSKVLNTYIKLLLESPYTEENLYNLSRGGTQKFISLKNIREFVIPIPPASSQKEMVKQYEEYLRITNLNRKLITEVEVKMQNKIKKLFE